MRDTQSIPEMLGFASISWDRTRSYSPLSYVAQYGLYLSEAEELRERHGREGHQAIDRELSLRYAKDLDYRQRLTQISLEGMIMASEPSDEVKRLVERMPEKPPQKAQS